MALIDKLSAIGNAIREKGGTTELLTLAEMPDAITNLPSGGSSSFPEEGMVLSGTCEKLFQNGKWEWAILDHGSNISTKDITQGSYMFSGIKQLKKIPFSINYKQTSSASSQSANNLFSNTSLTELPDVTGSIGPMTQMVKESMHIKAIPESWATSIDFTTTHKQTTYSFCTVREIFCGCFALRTVPEAVVKQLWNSASNANGYDGMFDGCIVLDEVVGLRGVNNTITTNMFSREFADCNRLKRVVFDTENNTPRVERWLAQTLRLDQYVGYAVSNPTIIDLGGISPDKEVYDDATYQALKNDPDWFTCNVAYSRYNHDSAVETINSLPDTSAYLAETSGMNMIKFTGEAGSKTDGGAINTLTEEEIAVATMKGWTVSLV